MKLGFESFESWLFYITELGILIGVVWGVILERKTHIISKIALNHTLNKYKRFKNKTIEDKIKEL